MGAGISDPYIPPPVLHNLRDLALVIGETCTEVENATVRIVKPDAAPGGEPPLVLPILEHGFDSRIGQAIVRGKPAEPLAVLVEHPC